MKRWGRERGDSFYCCVFNSVCTKVLRVEVKWHIFLCKNLNCFHIGTRSFTSQYRLRLMNLVGLQGTCHHEETVTFFRTETKSFTSQQQALKKQIIHATTGTDETGEVTWHLPSASFTFLSHRDKILHITTSIEETGDVQWQLLLCNLAVFAIVFLVLLKGIQSLGKVNILTLSHLPVQIVGWCIRSLVQRMHWHSSLCL